MTKDIITYAQIAAPIIFTLAGMAFFGWFKILKETNNLLRTQNEELKEANKDLQSKHDDSIRQLSSLQGQIDILKSIPLGGIDGSLKAILKFQESAAVSNEAILRNLEYSASLLALNTGAQVRAVEKVKEDLHDDDKNITRKVRGAK